MATNFRFTPSKQQAFLALIRLGTRPIAAARAIGVHPRTAKNFARSNPDFADELELAHFEAAEPVEEVIYKAALDGEPWATKVWLEAWNPKQWGSRPKEVRISGEISHKVEELGPTESIIELQRRALQRQDDLMLGEGEEEEEIFDVEVD